MIDLKIIDVSKIFFIINIFIFIYFLDNHIPGPNAYKNQSLIGCNIFDSRFKSPSFLTLSKRFRIIDRNAGNPGPGSYIRFSEFGILAPKRDKDKEKKENEKEENKNENPNLEENENNFENNIENNNHQNNQETNNENNNHQNNQEINNENNNNETIKGNENNNEIEENKIMETV